MIKTFSRLAEQQIAQIILNYSNRIHFPFRLLFFCNLFSTQIYLLMSAFGKAATKFFFTLLSKKIDLNNNSRGRNAK